MAIDFVTVDGEEAWADVTNEGDAIRFVLSIKSDGDYDVLLDRDAARTLGTALISAAGGSD